MTMGKINEFFEKHYKKLMLGLMLVIFVNTCGNPTKQLNKRVDTLSNKIDSMEVNMVKKNDLTIEGLKVEKRMIQSTNRNMMDVNRQSEIDKEIENLSK
jgi:ABC-type phosphate transport system auxiliary subunit